MSKGLTEEKVREIVMEGIEVVLKTLESYSSKEHTEKVVKESEKRIIKSLKPQASRIAKLEKRVYKLENKLFH